MRVTSPADNKRVTERAAAVRRPVAVDLFAGAGGLSLAFEQAGFDVLAAVEYDPIHAAVHEFNFPSTSVLCADVSALNVDDVRAAAAAGWRAHGGEGEWDGRIDVVFGGPPCQGFSTIGKRLVDDERNRLVFHFFRLVTELRPRCFVMENVPGMMQGGHSSILHRLVDEFHASGYQVAEPRVLQAAEFGVPQSRRRVFVVGADAGERLPEYPMPIVRPAGAVGPLPIGPTVWDAIGDIPDLDRFAELLEVDYVALSPAALRRMRDQASAYARILAGLDADPHDLSHPRNWNPRLLTSSMRTVHTAVSVSRFAATEPGSTEPVSRFYRLPPDGLCNTLRAGTGSERGAYTSPRPIHPMLPRVISVREAARLHSFPDWFRLHQTKWHGFRQVGNAVPPLLGRAVAAQVREALGMESTKPLTPLALGKPSLLTLDMTAATARFGVSREAAPMPRRRAAALA